VARVPTSFACSCGVLECTADDEDDADDKDKGKDASEENREDDADDNGKGKDAAHASEEVREAILNMEQSDEVAGKAKEHEIAVDVAQAGPWGTKVAEDGPSHEVDVEMAMAGVGKSK
jgi:hypothetical protein